jgi:hypothetical protein
VSLRHGRSRFPLSNYPISFSFYRLVSGTSTRPQAAGTLASERFTRDEDS